MKLYATPRSHFSRKIRLLLDHLGLAYDLVDVGNVAAATPERFDGNPAMSVPILEDGDAWLIESDHIAGHIVRTRDPADRYDVLSTDDTVLNARAVMNAIMANEVKLVLSARMGLAPDGHAYFEKARTAIGRSMTWLEQRADVFAPDDPAYPDFHFISLWDHLALYGVAELEFPRLRSVADALGKRDLVARSAPPALL